MPSKGVVCMSNVLDILVLNNDDDSIGVECVTCYLYTDRCRLDMPSKGSCNKPLLLIKKVTKNSKVLLNQYIL